MTNKTALKRLKLDPYFSKTIETNLNVWSHDVNSFEIKFEFYNHECDKPIDLTGADMRILLDHADSQPKVYPLEIESKVLGLAKFIMPKEIRGCEGKFTAHIYADYPNKTHDFGSFIFYTKLSRIDKGMGSCLDTVYVSEFEKALQDIKDKSNQFDGVEKELTGKITTFEKEVNVKIKKIEDDIASNEIAKQEDVNVLKKENARQEEKISIFEKGVNFTSPPNKYNQNDLWYFEKGTTFDGMNYAEQVNPSLLTSVKGAVIKYEKNNDYHVREQAYDIKVTGGTDTIKCFAVQGSAQNNEAELSIIIKNNHKEYPVIFHANVAVELNTYKIMPGEEKTIIITDPRTDRIYQTRFLTEKPEHDIDITYRRLFLRKKSDTVAKYSPAPKDVLGETNILKASRDNVQLDFNNWVAYTGELKKPNFIDLQKQIDELKNAITTLGGTL